MSDSYRIAVADDEPDVVAFLRQSLSCAGHAVVAEAYSGEQLVEVCLQVRPDLIITDIKMDHMDGLTAVESILEQHELPVIVLSAFHAEEFVERASECHALAYLVKPVKEHDLIASIPVAMRRFEELRTLRAEASNMRQALADRKVIERAKGLVMKKLDFDEPSAFHHLQQLARRKRQPLVEVAGSILLAEEAFEGTT